MKHNNKPLTQRVTNYEGGRVLEMSPHMALYSATVTSSMEHTYYEQNDTRNSRIRALVPQCDPLFVAKLAIYARRFMHLRSIPLVLVIELARHHRGDNLVSRTLNEVIQRADEITEALACYQALNQRGGIKKLSRMSKQVQKGIASAFLKFDEYQFAKYNRPAEITLRDALFVVHPKAKSAEQQVLFDKIATNTLTTPSTWEVSLSHMGRQLFENSQQKKEATKSIWSQLIRKRTLGYMATLRNLRNILKAKVDLDDIELVAAFLSNPKAVKNSKQLPFRFLSAYQQLQDHTSVKSQILRQALERAAMISGENIDGFDDDTRVLIACDVSGSMLQPISERSSVQLYDVGLILASVLQSRCRNTVTGIFGSRWMIYNFPTESILQRVSQLKKLEGAVGYATNGHKVIEHLNYKGTVMDKVLIFTDTQMWNSSGHYSSLEAEWSQYKRNIAPNASMYLFDLAGYGNTPVDLRRNDVTLIAGWSDKVFRVLNAVERGEDCLGEIDKVTLPGH